VSKVDDYRAALLDIDDRPAYLLANSNLPGPRGNLELATAYGDVGPAEEARRLAAIGPDESPTNDPGEFLAFCGTVVLGRLAVEGDEDALVELRVAAADPRWRVREAVAMALQRVGASQPQRLAELVREWSNGSAYERRAAVAAVAEPPLLRHEVLVTAGLDVLDGCTAWLAGQDPRDEGSKVLTKGLAYAWSVVVAADPAQGRPRMEAWLGSTDPVVRRVMRENLGKQRLRRLDPAWVERWDARLRP
jgi:hypothetical protein